MKDSHDHSKASQIVALGQFGTQLRDEWHKFHHSYSDIHEVNTLMTTVQRSKRDCKLSTHNLAPRSSTCKACVTSQKLARSTPLSV